MLLLGLSLLACLSRLLLSWTVGGVSHVELSPDTVVPISVSAVPFGPRIEKWRPSRFLGSLLRASGSLPGGLERFLLCSIGEKLLSQTHRMGKRGH